MKKMVFVHHVPQLNVLLVIVLLTTCAMAALVEVVNGAIHHPFSSCGGARGGFNSFRLPIRLQTSSSISSSSPPIRQRFTNLLKLRGGSSLATTANATISDNNSHLSYDAEEQSQSSQSSQSSSSSSSSSSSLQTPNQNQKVQTLKDQRELDIERIVHTQWQKFTRLAQLTTTRNHNRIKSRRVCLGLICAGVSLQTLSSQLQHPHAGSLAAIIGSISIAATPMVQKITNKEKELFVQSNTAMENIAREIYLFRAGVAPYNMKENTNNNALEIFVQNGRTIFEDVKDPLYLKMKHNGSLPPPKLDDMNSYLELRAIPMKEKYTNDLVRYVRLSSFFSNIRDGCLGASSLIGLLCSTSSRPQIMSSSSLFTRSFGVWSSVMTTLGSAFAHHLESNKFEDLSQDCARAVQDLETIIMLPPDDYESLVYSCEDIIASTTISMKRRIKNFDSSVSSSSTDEDGRRGLVEKKQQPKWNPDVVCGDNESGFYPASARKEWLIENKGMSEDDAKSKVMREYPSMFLYDVQ